MSTLGFALVLILTSWEHIWISHSLACIIRIFYNQLTVSLLAWWSLIDCSLNCQFSQMLTLQYKCPNYSTEKLCKEFKKIRLQLSAISINWVSTNCGWLKNHKNNKILLSITMKFRWHNWDIFMIFVVFDLLLLTKEKLLFKNITIITKCLFTWYDNNRNVKYTVANHGCISKWRWSKFFI